MNELVNTDRGVELFSRLKLGMILDRSETNRLLRSLENLDSTVAGCLVMQAQLRGILKRKDWLLISIKADPDTIRTTGVSIGIHQPKAGKQPKLSPQQKWQQRNGLRTR